MSEASVDSTRQSTKYGWNVQGRDCIEDGVERFLIVGVAPSKSKAEGLEELNIVRSRAGRRVEC